MSVCAFRSIRKPDLEGTGKTPVSYGEHFHGPIRVQRDHFRRVAKTRKLDDVKDNLSTTILIAEIANSDIHWMEPRDLGFNDMSFQVNDPSKPSISSRHYHGSDQSDRAANVGTVDGRALTVNGKLSPEIIKAMLTIDGGESIDQESIK